MSSETGKKMVIFVGGTSYSGSTMLDMILSNDPAGYSLGEIIALFWPTKKHHFEELRKIKESSKTWNKILSDNEKRLYQNLFDAFPTTNYFVDSSKSPFWIRKHSEILEKNGIAVKNFLVYKEPVDIAFSFKKRGRYNDWKRTWINYHRLYFSLIKDFKAISYKDFVQGDVLIKAMCEDAGIQYFKGKKEFWKKEHHTFFGNRRARVHTSNLEVKKDKEFLSIDNKNDYKKIYYKDVDDKSLIKDVDLLLKTDKRFEFIFQCLKEKDVAYKSNLNEEIIKPVFNNTDIFLRKCKFKVVRARAVLQYKN